MTDLMPELEGYVRQEDVNDIIKARIARDRKQRSQFFRDQALDEIRDELRDLRVMLAAIKDEINQH
jgi:hypothetical protein